jgi:hypothetical protein
MCFCSCDWGLVESISKLYRWEFKGLQMLRGFYLAWMKPALLCTELLHYTLLIIESDKEPGLWDELMLRLLSCLTSWEAKMSAIENYYVKILLLPLTPMDFKELKVCYLLSSSNKIVSPRSWSIDWTDSSTLFYLAWLFSACSYLLTTVFYINSFFCTGSLLREK